MGVIRVLSDQIANQIAAGEVVERPASVVKELIENALDAGACAIRIEAEGGGAARLRVVDDGAGMVRDDALLALERHATSKLRDAAGLSAISTLGFRGEALPSIAAVSHFTLETAPAGGTLGTRVQVAAGKLRSVEEAGLPAGTAVTVARLFANLPARRKFLKSEATELGHVAGLVTHYALAYPEIAFRLETPHRVLLALEPVASHAERLGQIFGAELLGQCVPFEATAQWAPEPGEAPAAAGGVGAFGFASRPELHKLNRNSIFLFVNRRLVRDRLLQHAVSSAYLNLLPSHVFPAVLLFLDLPFTEVDVNVHPSKTEVRFRRQNFVHDTVRDAIRGAISAARPVPDFLRERGARATASPLWSAPAAARRGPFVAPLPAHAPGVASELEISIADLPSGFHLTPAPVPPREQPLPLPPPDASPGDLPVGPRARPETGGVAGWVPETGLGCGLGTLAPAAMPADAGELAALRPLGQLEDSFIVAAGPTGLWLIDQHVAHERVLFEQFAAQRQAGRLESQRLLMPQVFDLDPGRALGFADLVPELEAAGFEAAPFGHNSVAVQAVPAGIAAEQVERLLQELLEIALPEERQASRERVRTRITATIACHAAIKVHMRLEPEKMVWLLGRLAQTAYPMTCPHGRPVLLRYSLEQIQRAFKRIS